MSDDRKRPAHGGMGGKAGGGKAGAGKPRGEKPRFDGPRQPREGGGEARPFRAQDGMKRAFGKSGDGPPAKPRPGKWERREAAAEPGGGERRPRKPHAPRDGDRPKFDKPRPEGPRSEGPRPQGPRPQGPRPQGPRSERPGSGKPRFDGPRKPRDGDGEKRAFVRREDKDRAGPRAGRTERREGPAEAGGEGSGERIARRLARAGVSSRRDAEAMIADGRITLNGKVLDTPAVNVGANDRIEIDGKPIPAIERTRLFLFHKPGGVVTTSRDPEGRRTVFDVLPKGLPRLMTVGRLDINTEGLLLLTNDGGLSRVLELPATGWLRRYRVRVHGKVDLKALEGLKEGIAVDGVFYGAVEAALDREQGSNAWLTIGLREGKNREVKNILGALGLDVTRLIRVSYGPFQLGDLPEGELRELKGKYLRDQLGERLIEEAGANFDAPILNAFSAADGAAGEPRKRADRPEPHSGRKWEDKREARREDALGRLDTRKPSRGRPAGGGEARSGRPGKPGGGPKAGGFGKAGPREGRPEEKPRARTANVWMAPGARPMGEKKKAALEERSEGRRYAGKPRPAGNPSASAKAGDKPRFAGKPGGGKPFGKPAGRSAGKPGGKGGPRKPRGPG